MKKLLAALAFALFVLPAIGQQTYREIILQTNLARTSTSVTGAVDTGGSVINYIGGGKLVVRVTAVSGTNPTLNARLMGEIGGNQYLLCETGNITAVGEYQCQTDVVTPMVRYSYVITGTSPSFTHQVYLLRY